MKKVHFGAYFPVRLHTCCVEVLAERGGEVLLTPFAKPSGGPEGMSDVGELLRDKIAKGAKLFTDKAGVYIALCRDNPDKNIFHAIVNHSQVNEFGFEWYSINNQYYVLDQ